MNKTFPKLILIYGPGSGLGKSTLSAALKERLSAQGRTVRFLKEEDVVTHPAFQQYVHKVQVGQGDDVIALTDACQRFVVELNTSEPEIVVLDSILLCWDWLYSAHCSDTSVSAFSRILADMVSSLGPVLVFMEGDQKTALSRAIKDRGQDWAFDLAELRTGQRDLDALATYFRRLRAGAERRLVLWPHHVLRVDGVMNDIDSCIDHVMSEISSTLYI